MTDDQATQIKTYVKAFNSAIVAGDTLDLVVDTVADRVLLYLNTDTLDPRIERIVAQVVVSSYKMAQADVAAGLGADRSVAQVSDNGQQVQYTIKPAQYMASMNDQELFTGFSDLLAPYRRLHVNHTPVQGYNQ